MALLTGDFFSQIAEKGESRPWRKRWVLYATLIWLFFLLSLPPLAEMLLKHRYPQYLPINIPLLPSALLILLTGLAWIVRKEKWMPCFVLLSSLWLALWFYGVKATQISEMRSTRGLAMILGNPRITSPHRIVTTRAESLAFYLPQKIEVVRNSAIVKAMLREFVPIVAVIKRKRLAEMQRSLSPRFFVWQDNNSTYALIANFPSPARP